MIMKTVIEHMRSLCPISDETVEELMKCVTLCHFPKRYQLIQENRFCKYAYFIEKGMTRSFWLVDGEEITTSFSCEGGIVFSMDELYYQKKSEEFVETLEEVEAYRIALTDLIRLFETNLEFCNWGRIIHQNEYRRLHRSHKERLTLPAKERYEEFQKQFPYVCQRTNLGFIASYLGITLSTLSRIRSASDNNS
jgi:CRP-like cAMP-binding protein